VPVGGNSLAPPSRIWVHFAVAALLAVLVFVTYSNSLRNGFVWDDHEQILKNPDLSPQSPLVRLFTSSVWGFQHPGEHAKDNQYRPMQMLTYRLTGDYGGLNATSFHSVSLLFHFAVSVLVYAVAFMLTRRLGVAVVAACLFASHPIHTEAVDWIASIGDLGCALFFLTSFFLYLRSKGWITLAGSALAFGVALLWKEMAVTLPFLIFAHSFLSSRGEPLRSRIKQALNATRMHWIVLAIYLALRFNALGRLYVHQQNFVLTPLNYILTDVYLLASYWWKLIWPVPLIGYHVFTPINSLEELRLWAAAIFLIVIIAGSVLCFRKSPVTGFLVSWIFLTLVPVLNVRAVGRNVFAERYLYIPSIGFCILAALLAERALKFVPGRVRTPLAGIAMAIVLYFYCSAAVSRNAIWKDDRTFFSQSLEASPDSAFLEDSVAELLRTESGDSVAAQQHYLRAITLAQQWNPPETLQVSIAYAGLAYILAQSGRFDEALRDLDLAQQADPLNKIVLRARGSILTQAGRWVEAKQVLDSVLRTDPNDDASLNAYGIVAWQGEHAYPLAIQYMERALQFAPTDVTRSSIQENLGAIYCEMGRYEEGVSRFRLAVEIKPNEPRYHVNLGIALRLAGRAPEARSQFLDALKIAPGFKPALAELAAEAR
jgi:tetratricopeptide (TPR) repeat protein